MIRCIAVRRRGSARVHDRLVHHKPVVLTKDADRMENTETLHSRRVQAGGRPGR